MYCGGRKYSPPSSPASIISRVFQASWFPNKLKQKDTNPDTDSSKSQRRYYPASITPSPSFRKEARFYGVDDDDAYWRLSFREDRTDGRKSIPGIPVSYSDDESQIPVSGSTSFGSRRHEEVYKSPRKEYANDRGSRKPSRKAQMERDIFPVETMYKIPAKKKFPGSPVSSSENEQTDEDYESRRVSVSEWQSSRPRRIKIKNRAKIYNSPKQEFRIRAVEEMKNDQTRLKYKETTIFDSFAEVKSSFDPQQDFRDSMVEMICEEGIRRPEELEDLLACYLTLNCDEYHDLIINVFQQVWLELKRGVY